MLRVDATKGEAAGRQAGVSRAARHDTSYRRWSARHARVTVMQALPAPNPTMGPIAPSTARYWKRVLGTALRETREAVRLDSFVRILTGVAAPIAAFLIVAQATGHPTWAGVVTVGVVLAIGIVVFLSKALSLPAKLFCDLELGGAETASQMVDAELDYRADLIDRLANYYVETHRGATLRMRAGLEMPPATWINAQLQEQGEIWFIHDVRGTRYCISERANEPVIE